MSRDPQGLPIEQVFESHGLMVHGNGAVGTDAVRGWVAALGRLAPSVDADLVEALRALEELKAAAAAAQARITLLFDRVTARPPSCDRGAGPRSRRSGRRRRRWRWPAGTARRKGPGTLGARLARGRGDAAAPRPRCEPGAQRVASHPGGARDRLSVPAGPRATLDAELAAPGALARTGDRGHEHETRRIATGSTRTPSPPGPRRRRHLPPGQPAPGTGHHDLRSPGMLPAAQGVAVPRRPAPRHARHPALGGR